MAAVGREEDAPSFLHQDGGGEGAKGPPEGWLAVQGGDAALRVCDAHKGKVMGSEVAAEGVRVVGPHHQDREASAGQFLVGLAQLREMAAAEGSGKPSEEHQGHGTVAEEIREVHGLALVIAGRKQRSR